MKKNDKAFDSVRMMRTIRDALSKRIQGLSFDEQRKLVQEGLRTRMDRPARVH